MLLILQNFFPEFEFGITWLCFQSAASGIHQECRNYCVPVMWQHSTINHCRKRAPIPSKFHFLQSVLNVLDHIEAGGKSSKLCVLQFRNLIVEILLGKPEFERSETQCTAGKRINKGAGLDQSSDPYFKVALLVVMRVQSLKGRCNRLALPFEPKAAKYKSLPWGAPSSPSYDEELCLYLESWGRNEQGPGRFYLENHMEVEILVSAHWH